MRAKTGMMARSLSDRTAASDKKWLSCSKRRLRSLDIRDFGEITHQPNKSGGSVSHGERKGHKDQDVAYFKVHDLQQPSLKTYMSMKAKKNLESLVMPSGYHKGVWLSGIHASVFSSGVRKKAVSCSSSPSCSSSQDLESTEKCFWQKGGKKCGAENQKVKKIEDKQKPTEKKRAHHRVRSSPNQSVTSISCRAWPTAVGTGMQEDDRDLCMENEEQSCIRVKAHVHLSHKCGRNTGHKELAAVNCSGQVIKKHHLFEKRPRGSEHPALMQDDEGVGIEGGQGFSIEGDNQGVRMQDNQGIGLERNTDELLAELSYCEKLCLEANPQCQSSIFL